MSTFTLRQCYYLAYGDPFPRILLMPRLATFLCACQIFDAFEGKPPGAIIGSVGGGGLVLGILQGLRQVKWDDKVPRSIPDIMAWMDRGHEFDTAMESGPTMWDPGSHDTMLRLTVSHCSLSGWVHFRSEHGFLPGIVPGM